MKSLVDLQFREFLCAPLCLIGVQIKEILAKSKRRMSEGLSGEDISAGVVPILDLNIKMLDLNIKTGNLNSFSSAIVISSITQLRILPLFQILFVIHRPNLPGAGCGSLYFSAKQMVVNVLLTKKGNAADF